ncbi:hypothetical protein GE09DRAFT_1167405 [Coniochaeta sp. 2T2.1]|nr:hypothetical protein GE09DRAFT_1167405 [Coniochaeta sp. 2T2.1]
MSSFREHITPALLKEVLDFWFSHFTSPRDFVAPPKEAAARWFRRDEEFDRACVAKFGPALEAIRSSSSTNGQVTASSLLALIDTSNPLNWVALVLLLDQMPRNTYRGEDAKVAYTVFDPLAQAVVTRAIKENVWDSPELRGRVAERCWLLFPYMHSESRELHGECVRMCEALVEEAGRLEDEGEREAARGFAETMLHFERRHQKIVERFGRYPHRNGVVGRSSTGEEEGYLRDGGETFSG